MDTRSLVGSRRCRDGRHRRVTRAGDRPQRPLSVLLAQSFGSAYQGIGSADLTALHDIAVLDPWIAALLYEVGQYIEAEGYWYEDGKWTRRSEWQYENGAWQLYDADGSRVVPRKVQVPSKDQGR